MKYLLDTHIIIWAAVDVKRLSRKAKSILENPENVLYFSPVSLWEISIKHAKHPKQMAMTSERAKELALSAQNALCGAALPGIPSPDPVVCALLSKMGVAPELSGYRYMAEAVRITLLHGALSTTKELYPQIALMNHVTVSAVERAIRHAIAPAWKHPASIARRQLFPGLGRPSNTHFIARIARACETSSSESDWSGTFLRSP